MIVNMPKNALIFFCLVAVAQGQPTPMERWSTSLGFETSVGNGCYLNPDDTLLVCTSSVGVIKGYNADTGGPALWEGPTISTASGITSTSGVSFNYNTPTPYMVYGVTAGDGSTSVIVSLDENGNELFQAPCNGTVIGTPKITFDGRYIIAICNEETIGTFHIFDANAAVSGSPLPPLGSIVLQGVGSPIGEYLQPIVANFEGGNENDLFMFMTPGSTLPGQIWAFQFPTNDTEALALSKIGEEKSFFTNTELSLGNGGLNLFVSGTGATFRSWAGESGSRKNAVDLGPSGRYSGTRGNPPIASSLAPAAMSQVLVIPGAAAELIFSDESLGDLIVRDTNDFLVSGKPAISPDGTFSYTANQGGVVTGWDLSNFPTDVSVAWFIPTLMPITGDMALNSAGTTLYVINSAGIITAYDLPDFSPTTAPTADLSSAPSAAASAPPSSKPTMVPSEVPSRIPSGTPSTLPSMFPSAEPSFPLSVSPSEPPTNAPTVAPTRRGWVIESAKPVSNFSSGATLTTTLCGPVVTTMALFVSLVLLVET